MNLEEYFRKTLTETGCIDHDVRCSVTDDGVWFYIHPNKVDGDTPVFKLQGNQLIEATEI
jgi:hypothetical protein